MALLDDVKTSLRITADDYDVEIEGLIDACELDLKSAGVEAIDETDALTKHAIILYTKGHFGYDNEEAERFLEVYENLKNKMALLSEYNTAVD